MESNAKLSRQMTDIKSMAISRNKLDMAVSKKSPEPQDEEKKRHPRPETQTENTKDSVIERAPMASGQLTTNDEKNATKNNSEPRDEEKHVQRQRENLDRPAAGELPAGSNTTDQDSNSNGNAWASIVRKRKPRDARPAPKANKTDQEKKPLGKLIGAAKVKRKVFYVGGIDPECAVEDLKMFCTTHCKLMSCMLIRSRAYGTQAAYVVVTEDAAATFANIEWPENLYCRPWSFGPTGEKLSETEQNPQ